MVNIRINDLPEDDTPNASDFVPVDALSTRKTTIADLVTIGRPLASQAEAEAGTDPSKAMTPLTTAQAIAALRPSGTTGLALLLSGTAADARGVLGVGVTGEDVFLANTAADIRALLDLEPGTDVQAQSAILQSLADETLTAGDLLYAADADTIANLPIGAEGEVLAVTGGVLGWTAAGTGDMLESVYDPRAKAGDPFPYDTVADFEAATVAAEINTVDIRGNAAAGDLGGFRAVRTASEPTDHDAWVQDAGGVYFINNEPQLDLRQFGVFGSDNEGALVDESTNITKALVASNALRRPLIIPATNYLYGGINIVDAFSIVLEGARGEVPIIHGTQALADAAGRLLRFNRGPFDIDAGVITVTANIYPGQKKITLSDTSQLAVGMIIEIRSNKLWYYDNRGSDVCAEAHEITRIVSGTQIEIWDVTRDFYDVSVETLEVKAYWGDRLEINSLKLKMPPPATSVSTVCLQTDRLFRPRLNAVEFEGATFAGFLNQRGWQTRGTDIICQKIGHSTVGYGISDRGVGSQYTGVRGHSMRRLIDFDGGFWINRDGLFKDFELFGGGTEYDGEEYYPEGDDQNYGVGMHGPCEGVQFQNGVISGVQEGVKVRGRDTSIRGVRFIGEFLSCISATYGTGLVVHDNTYDRMDFPDKVAEANLNDDAQAGNFIKFGVGAGIGDWNWGAPTSIKNNVANGLKDGFVWFAASGGTVVVENLDCEDNIVTVVRPAGTTFEFYQVSGTVRIARSKIGPNKIVNRGDGAVNALPGFATFVIANTSQVGVDAAVELSDGEFQLTMPDDTYAVIPDFDRQGGDRTVVLLTEMSGNFYGQFIVVPNSATFVTFGTPTANIAVTATGSALTGTTGTDGNFTLGMTNGDLYMENRTGNARRLRVRRL